MHFDAVREKFFAAFHDLTQKLLQLHKENTAPPNQMVQTHIQKTNIRSILNTTNVKKRPNSRNSLNGNANDSHAAGAGNAATASVVAAASASSGGNRKRLSMSDVSDMLYEFYRTNAAAKVPKSAAASVVTAKLIGQKSPTSAETHEPSSIAAIATNSAASETASKNLLSGEMMTVVGGKEGTTSTSFHPGTKYNATSNANDSRQQQSTTGSLITAIPTSVLIARQQLQQLEEPLDIKPLIHPTTGLVIRPVESVIKANPLGAMNSPAADSDNNPQAAVIAAALLRDGYHSFQQQIRAQELMKFHSGKSRAPKPKHSENATLEESTTTKILETFLRQQRNSECDNDTGSDLNDGDDEDDSRYNGFDDIHLMEANKANLPQLLQNAMANSSGHTTPGSVDYLSDESQKYMSLAAQAQAFRNLDFSMTEFGGNSSLNDGPTSIGPDGEPVYECRHCGKKYRWKSTLRRHENVECGGKEPSHQCPYCPYKSKQRGNLGVHVRKHHSNLPQLASKRRSKYSVKLEEGSNPGSANVSDDSNSRLIIDCSK